VPRWPSVPTITVTPLATVFPLIPAIYAAVWAACVEPSGYVVATGLPMRTLDTWRRQERAFGLLKKVYAKRAAIRGQQPTVSSSWPQQFQDWPQTTKQKSIPTERGSWKQRQNPRRLLVLFRARCTCFLFSRAILANTSPEIRERLGETQRRNKSLRQQKYFKLLVLHIGSRKTFADSVSESRCLGDGSIHGDRARVGCSTVGADSLPSPITERVSTGWRRAD
jgi:hypothetical protein